MSNSTNSEIEDPVKSAFYAVAFVLGLLGNLLVIIIVVARRKRRTANDLFILNLAISDLMYLFVCLPTNIYMMFADIQYDFFCRLIWPLMTVTVNISIFTLTSMAVFRCQVILNPFKPEKRQRYIFVWIIGIWLLGLILVIPLMLVTKPKLAKPQGCTEVWPSYKYRQAYTVSLFVLQYFLPLTIIAVAYVRIGLDLVGQAERQVPDNMANLERRKENMQVIKTLATIVILFAICMLPAQLAWILYDFALDDHETLINFLFSFSPSLLYFHSCLNPIAYGTLTKHFRHGYIRFFSFIFCCQFASFFKRQRGTERLAFGRLLQTCRGRKQKLTEESDKESWIQNNNSETEMNDETTGDPKISQLMEKETVL